MDMIIGPVLEIVKLAWGPIGRRIGYIKNLKKNMKELDKHDLFAARDDVLNKINSNKPTEVCNKWLENVKQVEDEVKAIREEYNKDKKCLMGWCPDIYSRMKLGKRVEGVIKEMTDQSKKRLEFHGKELPDAPVAPLKKVLLQDIVEVKSSRAANLTLQKILGFINDDRVRKIGIYGMGGMGKTTVMKLLNNQLGGSQEFEIIIFITVSREGNERKVLKDIANRLNLSVSNESDDRLNIHQFLKGKEFLLLLDDVWQKIGLFDIGIPDINESNKCKVVLATRDFGVCQDMETDKEVKIQKLSEEEAWSLFTKKADVAMYSTNIEPIARGIVKKCDGLPLAIKVIGSSLRKNHDVAVWTHTLTELKSPPTCQIRGMEKEVFSCLRISYDRLSEGSERNLFLYCSLYPEDYKIVITELAEYYWLEGNMEGVDSIEEAWNKGFHMVSNLVNASLLERGNDEKHIKMHDIVRVFALNEASGFLVKTGKHVKHPPKENEWLQPQKISLMQCSLDSLFERPNCSTLSTLLLQDNDQLTMIPDSFFECMHSLCILDLSRTKIKSLPSSLCKLVNLRGLYLKDCLKLKELPSHVGALMQLELLHLGGNTAIRYLPREVGELTRLKCLIVGFKYRNYLRKTGEWNIESRVPTGIIPKLSYLEELSLHVYVSGCGCVEKGQWHDESMEVVVEELCRLEHLNYLDAYFPKVECLEHFLAHSKSVKATSSWFKGFRFRVGTEIWDTLDHPSCSNEWERSLVYKGGLGMSQAAAIMETLAHSSFFHLRDHRTIRKLSELGLANMNELKECQVKSCDKMETLFDGDEQHETCAWLPNLDTLDIIDLPELRSFCNGPLLPGSFSKLTSLFLISCENLKKVFQLGIIRQLCSLEILFVSACSKMEEIIEIEEEMSISDCSKMEEIIEIGEEMSISDCSKMEEIIEIEEEMSMSVASHSHNVTSYNNDRLILPNIRLILLWSLPELVSICRGFSNFKWPSLETIDISKCPKLKSLSFLFNGTNIVAPALKRIKGRRSWWEEELEWEDNDLKQRLQPFFLDADRQ